MWVRSQGWEDPLERGMATLQHSCLKNLMGRGAWWAVVQWVAKSWTQLKQIRTHAHLHIGITGFRGGSVVKNLPTSAGDPTCCRATKLVQCSY